MIADPVLTPALKLDIEQHGSEALIRGKGKLTGSTTEVLHASFRGLIPGAKSILLDFTNVNYIDASGLSALLGVYISAQRVGCQLQLSNQTRTLRHTLASLAWPDFYGLMRQVAARATFPMAAAGRRFRARWI